MKTRRLIGVDPSLTCSGWALFDLRAEKLIGVGKIRSLPPRQPLAMRLNDLQTKITSLLVGLRLGPDDLMVCEAQTTMRDPRAAFKVEQVRGIFETVARSLRISVPGRLNPRTVQSEMMGLRGRQLKRISVKQVAVSTVEHLYSTALGEIGFDRKMIRQRKHQDIVDAILIGSLGVVKLKSADRTGLPAEQFFEERAIRPRRRAA